MRFRTSQRPGFTLMELLIVIGIIGVLVAITLVVGNAVANSSKRSTTELIIRTLDNSLSAYISDTGDIPPAFIEDPRVAQNAGTYGNQLIPIVDGRNMTDTDGAGRPPGNQMVNSAGLFVLQMNPVTTTASVIKARSSPAGKKAVDAIPSKLVKTVDPDTTDAQPPLATPLDGWGRPLRYVHPQFQGIITDSDANPNQDHDAPRSVASVLGAARAGTTFAFANFRRNASTVTAPAARTTAQLFPDSDGGRCVGNRPYFYSAGEDGLVGMYVGANGDTNYNDDNVYSTTPTLPSKYR